MGVFAMANRQVQSKSTCNAEASNGPFRVRRLSRAVRLLGLAAVVLLSSCASGGGSNDPSRGKDPAPEPTAEALADGILVCPIAGSSAPAPWISLPAMNKKLRHFPDFARASGLKEIKTCADGFAFWKQYDKYRAAFPYFDANEPFDVPDYAGSEEVGAPPVTEEQYRAAEGIGPKIKNGTGAQLSPVVRIYFDKNDGQGPLYHYCTGTFIGRNWILTAAHCLQVKKGWKRGQDPANADLNAGYYTYNIQFYGANGKIKNTQEFTRTQQVMDSRYTGWNPNNPYHAFDIALLYISKEFDGYLPNMDPSLGTNTFPLMRVSAADHLVDVPSASFWGAGLLDNDTVVPNVPNGGGGSGGSSGSGGRAGSSGAAGSSGRGGTGGTAGSTGGSAGSAGFAGVTRIYHEAGENEARLRYGSLAPYEVSFSRKPETPYLSNGPGSPEVARTVRGNLFYSDYPSSPPASTAYTCHGDSGGPLVEPWLVKDQNGNPSNSYVVAGVLAEHVFYNGIFCTQDSDCQGGPLALGVCDTSITQCLDLAWECQDSFGRGSGWAPTVYEKEWIQRNISAWYKSNFHCTTGQRVDFTGIPQSEQFLQCWGKPCKYDTKMDLTDSNGCEASEFCLRPGSELQDKCNACPTGDTKCGCYYGQCFPRKKP